MYASSVVSYMAEDMPAVVKLAIYYLCMTGIIFMYAYTLTFALEGSSTLLRLDRCKMQLVTYQIITISI
jgi:hypothetical protein